MKSIVNVYKDAGLWHQPPPGIGDYLRGCAYLIQAAREGPFAGRFDPGVNFELSAARPFLAPSTLERTGPREQLAAAVEHFDPGRDGDLVPVIDAFLRSSEDVLHVSTNHSWRGVDDEPPRPVLDALAQIMTLTPAFADRVRASGAPPAGGYVLLHIRDADRGGRASPVTDEEAAYCDRARRFVEGAMRAGGPGPYVCISNNERLRDFLCRTYGLANPNTQVGNTGFAGVLSEGELFDMALVRGARRLYALSFYGWNSGFTVWTSRIFGTPAMFANAATDF